jgi:hypothetical protein
MARLGVFRGSPRLGGLGAQRPRQLAAGPITLTKAGPWALRPARSGLKVTLRLTQPGASPAPKSVTLRLRRR